MGSGVGEASSEEEKWKWRAAICDEQWEEALEDERRKKWDRKGGVTLQVKANPYDLSNTILKMAKKRAMVDACLSVCACSDIFSQDLEEISEHMSETDGPMVGKAKDRHSGGQGKAIDVSFRFGKYRDVPLEAIPDDGLGWYAKVVEGSINDPSKREFVERNKKSLDAIKSEMEKRKSKDIEKLALPSDKKYGEWAGQPLVDIPTEFISDFLDGLSIAIDDPDQAKYKGANESLMEMLIAEIERRK